MEGRALSWAFYIEGHTDDMDFTVFYEKKNMFLVEKRRVVSSESKKEKGSIQLRESGKYVLKFDNSYSNRSKVLHYSLSLLT